ncbi:mitochondrial cardiolipin synthase, putative [Hepatocystis sp. ex Piliocolobus tephrosceles]|nr:mitochondrial cardiolipin synthase, putative [Hepatocystis sp. ex Piliocolobus tephrosceles]
MKIPLKIKDSIYNNIIKNKTTAFSDEEKYEVDFKKIVNDNINQLTLNDENKAEAKIKWENILKNNAKNYGKYSSGNKIKIYNNNILAFIDILKSINKSKKRVWFESYIFDDSKLSSLVVDSLCNASQRGCDVILLIDFIGSKKIKNKWINKLKKNNVQVILFNNFLNSFFNVLPIFFRDHRKIIIADNTAYCGSMNVSDSVVPNEYIQGNVICKERIEEIITGIDNKVDGQLNSNLLIQSHNKLYEGCVKDLNLIKKENKSKGIEFYDLHIKMKGPAVKHLANVFIDSLNMSNSNIIRTPIEDQQMYTDSDENSNCNDLINKKKKKKSVNDCYVQILESNVLRKIKSIQNTFDYVIRNGATESIYITTSYFLPPGFLRRALFSSMSNGVDISFLLSGNSDVLGDVLATYNVIKKFLKRQQREGSGSGSVSGVGVGSGSVSGSGSGSGVGSGSTSLSEDEHNKNHLSSENLVEKNLRGLNKNMYNINVIKNVNLLYLKQWAYLINIKNQVKKRMEFNFLKKKKTNRKEKNGNSIFYHLQDKHCHAKNIVIDNVWCSIGSFNWDRFSSRRNLEVMISVFNKQVCDQFINEHKKKIQQNSKQVTLAHIVNRNFFENFLSYCAYHLGRLSGKNIFDGLSNNSKKIILKKAIINRYLRDNCIRDISLHMMWGV